MIKKGFLKKQIKKSSDKKKTSAFIRQLVFYVVDKALERRYGHEYPSRCLQSSVGIQLVLKNFGIDSSLWSGAVCFAGVYEDTSFYNWVGFWDKDHHIWVISEFLELVDLTIQGLHLHPKATRKDGIPIPAVWWDDVSRWPNTMLYLPDAKVTIKLNHQETKDLNEFKKEITSILQETLDSEDVSNIKFSPIISGEDSMYDLFQKKHPWVVKASVFNEFGLKYPPWIQRRDKELRQKH